MLRVSKEKKKNRNTKLTQSLTQNIINQSKNK